MLNLPQDALSCTRYQKENYQDLKMGKGWVTTYVSRGSIGENPDRTLSILRTCSPEQTMLQTHGGVI
jgi:hypothetical protein